MSIWGTDGLIGKSAYYVNVPDWVYDTSTNYDKGDYVKYNGNVWEAMWWTQDAPGTASDPANEAWQLRDEMYDLTGGNPARTHDIVGYLPSSRADVFDFTKPVPYQYMTHGVLAFIMFDETALDGSLATSSTLVISALLGLVKQGASKVTPAPKLLVGVGGATDFAFNKLLSREDDAMIQKMSDNIAAFVATNGLDGVDLDLECWWAEGGSPSGLPTDGDQGGRMSADGPAPAGNGLQTLITKLRADIRMAGKLISAAVFGTPWYGNCYPTLTDLDWIGVMSYDFTGSWNASPVGPHAATHRIKLQRTYFAEQQGAWPGPGGTDLGNSEDNPITSMEDSIWYWTNPNFRNWQGVGHGMDRSKVYFGIPTYGYDFSYKKDKDPVTQGVRPGYKVISYSDIIEMNEFI